MRKLTYPAIIAVALLLSACGGDSGSSSETRLKKIIIDDNADNKADQVYTLEYDSESYLSSATMENCDDGTPKSSAICSNGEVIYTYAFSRDAAKNITGITITKNTGTVKTVELVYDGSNAIVSMKSDYTSNGTFNYAEYYTTNSDGDITRADIDNDNDGIVDDYSLFTYFTAGKPYHYELNEDYISVPAIDYAADYSYDADSNVTDVIIDEDGDGTKDEYRSYSYDENGKLAQIEIADSFGGTPAGYMYMEYEEGAEKGTYLGYILMSIGLFI